MTTKHFDRRTVLSSIAGLTAFTPVGYAFPTSQSSLADEFLSKAKTFLSSTQVFDAHAHPGRSFLTSNGQLSSLAQLYKRSGTFEHKTLSDMKVGGVSAAGFALVSDFNLLDFGDHGLEVWREFGPSEAWASYKSQITRIHDLAHSGEIRVLSSPLELNDLSEDVPGAWIGIDGGDFLEGSEFRLQEAKDDGLRTIGLVHYSTNELCDTAFDTPVHNGLSNVGKKIVREMNRLGLVIDVSHASNKSILDTLNVSTSPIICSQTHITPSLFGDHRQYIKRDTAKEIAKSGGVICAWPTRAGAENAASFSYMIAELVDCVGIEHTAIGSDMDAHMNPAWRSYRDTPWLVSNLFARGFSVDELAMIFGKNIQRVWANSN